MVQEEARGATKGSIILITLPCTSDCHCLHKAPEAPSLLSGRFPGRRIQRWHPRTAAASIPGSLREAA